MLNEISWSSYLTGLIIIVICYYIIIISLYFKDEVRAFLNHKSFISSEAIDEQIPLTGDHQLAELETTVEKIDHILQGADKDISKSELLEQFSEVLANFTGLGIPAWKVAVYNHIISETGLHCGITISAEELDRMG